MKKPYPLAELYHLPRRHLSFPVLAVDEGLTNEALGIMLRVFVAEERHETATFRGIAEAGGSTEEVVRETVGRLCDLGILTTDPLPESDELERPEDDPTPVEYGTRVWHGTWTALLRDTETVPAAKTAVVYFMFDAKDRLAYVGSTDRFRKRMTEHSERRRSDSWVNWTARECPTRGIAYALEDREIRSARPYQNSPGARRPAGTRRAS